MNAPVLRVLVIDDEPPIRKLLRMGLRTQGYEILEAPNGKTASSSSPRTRIWSFSISASRTCRGSSCCA